VLLGDFVAAAFRPADLVHQRQDPVGNPLTLERIVNVTWLKLIVNLLSAPSLDRVLRGSLSDNICRAHKTGELAAVGEAAAVQDHGKVRQRDWPRALGAPIVWVWLQASK